MSVNTVNFVTILKHSIFIVRLFVLVDEEGPIGEVNEINQNILTILTVPASYDSALHVESGSWWY